MKKRRREEGETASDCGNASSAMRCQTSSRGRVLCLVEMKEESR